MKTIHRYQLDITDKPQTIQLPAGYQILTIAPARGGNRHIDMWAEIDTDDTLEPATFHIYGTGWEIGNTGTYIGTAVFSNNFVWHAYNHATPPK